MERTEVLWISYLILASSLMLAGGLLVWFGIRGPASWRARLALVVLVSVVVVAAAVAAMLEERAGW